MTKQYTLDHKIQRHIIRVLTFQKYARFRDMRLQNTETNLYSYHLQVMLREKFVVKTSEGYTLGERGIEYISQSSLPSDNAKNRQTKISILFVIQNSNGDVLLHQRDRQPFIGTLSLPGGKMFVSDYSLEVATKRILSEGLGVDGVSPKHVGDCYVRVMDSAKQVIISDFIHVMRFESDAIDPTDRLMWARPHRLVDYQLAPAVETIITRTFFNDPYFFEEYTELLSA